MVWRTSKVRTDNLSLGVCATLFMVKFVKPLVDHLPWPQLSLDLTEPDYCRADGTVGLTDGLSGGRVKITSPGRV